MKLPILEKDKERLINGFNLLKSVDEKLDFWINDLEFPYYNRSYLDNSDIEPFIIYPKNPKEIGTINTKCIDLFTNRDDDLFIPRIPFFEELKNGFIGKYESALNKPMQLEVEKLSLENTISDYHKANYMLRNSKEYFQKAFNDFYINGIEPDLTVQLYEMEELMAITYGHVLAQYKIFLEGFDNKSAKNEHFSHAVQMLILDYLMVGKHLDNNVIKAEIYAKIISRDKETTRQIFSRLQSHKNEKNLRLILEYFKKGKFKTQIELVETDLNKLKKIKK